MNDNNTGKPKEGGKKPLGRPGRHGGGSRSHASAQGKPQRDSSLLGIRKEDPKKVSPAVDCAICTQPIFDLTGALADRESGLPVHFDCALEKVVMAEPLGPKEKIVYLGAGCFAAVEYKNGNDGAFVVKRRIRWEKEGEKQAWRKDISSYITKI